MRKKFLFVDLNNKNMMDRFFKILIFLLFFIIVLDFNAESQPKSESKIKLARAKYSGGGDWYNDPSSEVNLLHYVANVTNIPVDSIYEFVDLATDNLFNYPLLFLTGHGNMKFTEVEVKNLRTYLENGGFLFIDDDYGLDKFARREMKRVFPDQEPVELPFNHGIYNCFYNFPGGLPKTHVHDGLPAQGFGWFYNGRLCVFYGYQSNISDGWADSDAHDDPPAKREEALKMGVNIIVWALTN